MIIKTKNGLEINLSPEELRHFGIETPEEVKDFIDKIGNNKKIGFKKENKDEN